MQIGSLAFPGGEQLLFSKKLLNEKIFETSFPIKKVIFIFVVRRLLPFKRDSAPRNGFYAVFSENIAFFEKLSNKKIFGI